MRLVRFKISVCLRTAYLMLSQVLTLYNRD